jgi:preprotein translocase subunit SecE
MDEKTVNPNENAKEAKETKSSSSNNDKKDKKSNFKFSDYKGEFNKIIWPSREALLKQTVTVIFTSLLVGAIIFAMDTVFNYGYATIVTFIAGLIA